MPAEQVMPTRPYQPRLLQLRQKASRHDRIENKDINHLPSTMKKSFFPQLHWPKRENQEYKRENTKDLLNVVCSLFFGIQNHVQMHLSSGHAGRSGILFASSGSRGLQRKSQNPLATHLLHCSCLKYPPPAIGGLLYGVSSGSGLGRASNTRSENKNLYTQKPTSR